MMVGTILGILLGVITDTISKVLLFGISIGGVMFILPRMVRILMEGLLPLEAIKSISMPNTLTVTSLHRPGHARCRKVTRRLSPTALSADANLGLYRVCPPGMKSCHLATANLAVMASMIALASCGNIFRTVLAAIPVIIADLWIVTKIAPFITGMAKDVNQRLKAPAARFQFP